MGEMGTDKTDYQKLWLIFFLFISGFIWLGTGCVVFPGSFEQLLSFPPFYLFVVNFISGPIIIFIKVRKWSEYNKGKKRNILWILLFTTCLNLILAGVVSIKTIEIITGVGW